MITHRVEVELGVVARFPCVAYIKTFRNNAHYCCRLLSVRDHTTGICFHVDGGAQISIIPANEADKKAIINLPFRLLTSLSLRHTVRGALHLI